MALLLVLRKYPYNIRFWPLMNGLILCFYPYFLSTFHNHLELIFAEWYIFHELLILQQLVPTKLKKNQAHLGRPVIQYFNIT